MKLETRADIHVVLELYSTVLYRIAYNYTNNRSDAEDIGQEVFLKLIDKNPDFENEEARKAWLIRVTMNRCISLLRSPWRRRMTLGIDVLPLPSKTHSNEDVENLTIALKALEPRDRVIIDLYYYEGYSTSEIAKILECKHGAIRSRMSRARKKLKETLVRLEEAEK